MENDQSLLYVKHICALFYPKSSILKDVIATIQAWSIHIEIIKQFRAIHIKTLHLLLTLLGQSFTFLCPFIKFLHKEHLGGVLPDAALAAFAAYS